MLPYRKLSILSVSVVNVMRVWIVIPFLLILAACAPGTGPSANTGGAAAQGELPIVSTQGQQVAFSIGDIDLSILRPDGWETYSTDYGIVLAENIVSVAQEGEQDGLLMHLFIPPLDDLSVEAVNPSNLAWEILSEIIEDPAYVGSASVSAPYAFEWGGFDAAYYLLDNGDGSLSIVLGIAEPRSGQLITCNISAPIAQAERIRAHLPALLDGLVVNGVTLSGTELNSLPDPFEFPYQDTGLPSESGLLTGR